MFKVCGPGEIMPELTIVTIMHYLTLELRQLTYKVQKVALLRACGLDSAHAHCPSLF